MGGESREQAGLELMAQMGLDWLAGNVEELSRFMGECGYTPDRLRSEIGSRALAVAIVEYFARNEPQLLAMTANAGISAEEFMRAYWKLNPGAR